MAKFADLLKNVFPMEKMGGFPASHDSGGTLPNNIPPASILSKPAEWRNAKKAFGKGVAELFHPLVGG